MGRARAVSGDRQNAPEQCFRWALFDHPPLSTWVDANVVLSGDAAHASLPFMASGAAMALEDAWILARCVQAESEIGSAFQRFQTNRLARTRMIQQTSRRLGRVYHLPSRLMRRTAFTGMSIFGRRQQGDLASYDARTVPLMET